MSRLARSYAKAVLNVAKTPAGATAVREDLRRLVAATAAQPLFHRLTANPAVPMEVKEKALTAITSGLGLGPLASELATLLLRNYRMAHLPAILAVIEELVNRRLGVAVAHVTTAEALDGGRRASLVATLGRLTGRQVEVTTAVDPKLLGGFVARVDSTLYDGSLAGQLDRLADRLAGVHEA